MYHASELSLKPLWAEKDSRPIVSRDVMRLYSETYTMDNMNRRIGVLKPFTHVDDNLFVTSGGVIADVTKKVVISKSIVWNFDVGSDSQQDDNLRRVNAIDIESKMKVFYGSNLLSVGSVTQDLGVCLGDYIKAAFKHGLVQERHYIFVLNLLMRSVCQVVKYQHFTHLDLEKVHILPPEQNTSKQVKLVVVGRFEPLRGLSVFFLRRALICSLNALKNVKIDFSEEKKMLEDPLWLRKVFDGRAMPAILPKLIDSLQQGASPSFILSAVQEEARKKRIQLNGYVSERTPYLTFAQQHVNN